MISARHCPRTAISALFRKATSNMSPHNRAPLIIPISIIVVGVGWLLTVQGFGPGINWVWTLGLAVIGILTLVLSSGFDIVSVVIGPFFLLASLLSMLRQTGQLS